MENPKIKSRFLTFEQQLRILEMVLKTIEEKKYKSGICNIITNILSNEEEFKRFNLFVLDRLFPLLTCKNAKKYGNSKETGVYWWEIDPFDFESRINFIRWMIKKINIELEDKKQSDYWWKNVYYDLKSRFNFTDKIIKKLHLNK